MSEVGLYVDVENLQDIAKQAILSTLESWPDNFPRPTILHLYVRADQSELWKIWASSKCPSQKIQVKGVQHYVLKGSKNSADISLALDAISDIILNRVTHVSILSDDSDFASLFTKIRDEVHTKDSSIIPFLWFITDRPDTRSPTLGDFFPSEYLIMINCSNETGSELKNVMGTPGLSEDEKIAEMIIQHINIGQFKSTDCRRIIEHYFPRHSLVGADNPSFGTHFAKSIWPILEQYGVIQVPKTRGTRKYEMTESAKQKVGV